MLVRSKADPSIIALVQPCFTRAIKIKGSDRPYPGEHGPGSEFTYAARLWTPVTSDDQAAYDAFDAYCEADGVASYAKTLAEIA